jgi:G:T-mismatch repair DNA endonuclease (very short patch repair protein)
LYSFRNGNTGCGECCKHFSQAERDISDYIKSLGLTVIENDRSIISPLELDIVIPEKNIAIEYCGLYWHGETKGKDIKYHLNKLKRCVEMGYRLITIFEDEWINKRDIVEKRLNHILGDNNKRVYARKCDIKEISPKIANEFINQHHVQGSTGSSVKLGLYYNNELVSVMTFAKPSLSKGRKSFDNVYELSRFCSSVHVVGGASKLLTHFKRNYEWNEIFTFADRRWSKGNVYEKLGFESVGETKPNYWYFKTRDEGIQRKHRFNYRKDRLPVLFNNVDMDMTEWQIMQSQGFDRIWDCGNLKYITRNKS